MHPSFKHGLIHLCQEYMQQHEWSAAQQAQINTYLEFLRKRARGLIPTDAKFIRDFVLNHPSYQKDSIVSSEIAFDLVTIIDKLELNTPESADLRAKLLGSPY